VGKTARKSEDKRRLDVKKKKERIEYKLRFEKN
jgi:hypothetical protein